MALELANWQPYPLRSFPRTRRGGESNRQSQPIGVLPFLAMISASSGHENRDTGTRYAKQLIDRDAAAAILDRWPVEGQGPFSAN